MDVVHLVLEFKLNGRDVVKIDLFSDEVTPGVWASNENPAL
jgi:hypothetical protein